MSKPDWLPPLIKLSDYGGNWQRYEDAIFAEFYRDFIENRAHFRGLPVRLGKGPMYKGKELSFWHSISEGRTENERTPALERCERIRWIRALIDHSDDLRVRVWHRVKARENRFYLWFEEKYLVVLGERSGYYLLITAFCTDWPHTKNKLRKEWRACRKN